MHRFQKDELSETTLKMIETSALLEISYTKKNRYVNGHRIRIRNFNIMPAIPGLLFCFNPSTLE